MLHGPIQETVEIFHQLKESGNYKMYALTNWPTVLFDIALIRYNFLHWFDGRVVSGEEKTRKPFPEFYHVLLNRYRVDPSEAIFIDDNERNVKAGEAVGIQSIHFQSTAQLREKLEQLNLI
jgi:2-haloacid dehalogenase